MRKDKEFIFKLRREGKSYREIQVATGVSRGTLGKWFQAEEWSNHLVAKHSDQSIKRSRESMIRMNMVRKLKLQYSYAIVESEAIKQYEAYNPDSLFWAGLMIYTLNGDKKTKNMVRISSGEFYIHKIFGLFCQKYLDFKREKIKYELVLQKDSNVGSIKEVWMKELGVQEDQFYKTQFSNSAENPKRLQFGVGLTIISSTSLKKKILKWLELSKNEIF